MIQPHKFTILFFPCSCTGEVGGHNQVLHGGVLEPSRCSGVCCCRYFLQCTVSRVRALPSALDFWTTCVSLTKTTPLLLLEGVRGFGGGIDGDGWCVRASHRPADRPQIAAQPATFTGSASFSLSSHSPSVQVSFSTWKFLFKRDSVQIAFQTVV